MKEKYAKEKRLKKAIIGRIEENFGSKVKEVKRLVGGINNICYLIQLQDGRKFLAKKYYKDDRKRLEREYEALSYFDRIGLFRVPKPYFSDKKLYLGVYSFEEGIIKKPEEIGEKEILDLVDYAVKLHSIKPTRKAKDAIRHTAVLPVFSLNGHIENLRFKFERFNRWYTSLAASNSTRLWIDKRKLIQRMWNILREIQRPLPEFELKKTIVEKEKRFNHIDLGFHNAIYKKIGSKEIPCMIDYELSGWDYPYRMVGDFVTHEKNKKIPENLRRLFLEEYSRRRELNDTEKSRSNMTADLMDIEWVATYLWSITPEKIKMRRISIKNFNKSKYVCGQLEKVQERLEKFES